MVMALVYMLLYFQLLTGTKCLGVGFSSVYTVFPMLLCECKGYQIHTVENAVAFVDLSAIKAPDLVIKPPAPILFTNTHNSPTISRDRRIQVSVALTYYRSQVFLSRYASGPCKPYNPPEFNDEVEVVEGVGRTDCLRICADSSF